MQNPVVRILLILNLVFLLFLAGCGGRSRADRYGSVNEGLAIGLRNADDIVEGVRSAMQHRSETITIRYRSGVESMEDIEPMVDRIMRAALEETGDCTQGDYIRYQYGGYKANYQYSIEGEAYLYKIEIKPRYYTDAEEEEKVTAKVEEILGDLGFSKQTSEEEKIRAIYDYVTANVEYDSMHRLLSHYHQKSTAYAALFDHKATCQGISVLLYRLLREAGLDCRIITGAADMGEGEEFHSWNIVRVGEACYNLDATWDAQIGSRQFFLLSDQDFLGHTRDAEFAAEEFCEKYPMGEESLIPEGERPDPAMLLQE